MEKTPNSLVDVDNGLKFAKSPRWTGQKLLFLDIHDRCIKSTDLAGKVRTVLELPFLPGGFDIQAEERLIVSDALRLKICQYDADGQMLATDLAGVARFRLGDIVVDSCGGVYVGDDGFDCFNPLVDPVPNGVIVYVNAEGDSSVVADNLFSPNGFAVTPDNSTLIVGEMLGHRLTSFTIENDGSLRNRRVWAQFNNDVKPSGLCLDSEGAIWVAGAGRAALRVKEGGEIEQQVTTNRPAYAVTLGGPERRHLFMCTSTTNDPVMTRQVPGATIDIADIDTPGH
jgi:sugar lactone lactonase YvrE